MLSLCLDPFDSPWTSEASHAIFTLEGFCGNEDLYLILCEELLNFLRYDEPLPL